MSSFSDRFAAGFNRSVDPAAYIEELRLKARQEQRAYDEQQRQRGLLYAEELLGTKGRDADPTLAIREVTSPSGLQMHAGGFGEEAIAPSGLLGGQMGQDEYISRARFNPYQNAQTTGANMSQNMEQSRGNEFNMAAADLDSQRKAKAASLDYQRGFGSRADAERIAINAREHANTLKQAQTKFDASNEALTVKDTAKLENDLRDDFDKGNTAYNQVYNAYSRIVDAQDTGIGDVGVLYSIMKMFDPGAAVQEGDKANVADSVGISRQIKGMYNQVLDGRALPAGALDDIRAQAGAYMKSATDEHNRRRGDYVADAERFGLNPKSIVGTAREERKAAMKASIEADRPEGWSGWDAGKKSRYEEYLRQSKQRKTQSSRSNRRERNRVQL